MKGKFVKLGNYFRIIAVKKLMYRLGGIDLKGVKISSDTVLYGNVKLSPGVELRGNVYVSTATIGKNVVIERNASIIGVEKTPLVIGDETYIGHNCIIDGAGGLEIGDYVHISANVSVWTHNAVMKSIRGLELKSPDGRVEKKTVINSNVWIGGNSTVFPGIEIGSFSMISPGSNVDTDVKEKSKFSH